MIVELLRIDSTQQSQVGGARRLEELHRLAGIGRFVFEVRDPLVLIERLNGNAIMSEDGSYPPAHDDLHVGEVCDDLDWGPLVGRRFPPQKHE